MKKIIAFLLVFTFLFSMASCNFGPATQQTTPAETTPEVTTPAATTEHVHEFVLSEADSTPAKCLTAGLEVSICSCGAREEKEVEALGHNMLVAMENKPSCTTEGKTTLRCSKCGKMQTVISDPLGHNYEETASEPSRTRRCLNEGCTSCAWNESNGTHTEALTFNFTKEDEAAIDAKYDEVLAKLNAAAKYDPSLHGFAEEGALAEEYAIVDALHTELYELILNAISQRQLAEIAYYCNMKDTALEETYTYMMDYHTAVVAKFYTLSRPFYDSCYREFYYQGMSEEEINSFLFDSDTVSNPEYTALKERNNAIEAEFLGAGGSKKEVLPGLYAEFAANNNKMAQLMGYDNYLEYAYENVYGREYTYEDAAELSEYVKTYVGPIFNDVYRTYRNLTGATPEEKERYESQTKHSFFENLEGNTYVNDYIDIMAFNTNPDKMISFSDEFNKLMGDGNMFRGQYNGAFVTTISGVNIPIAYFGASYDSPFTIVHEFGHFMNEIYSADVAEEFVDFNQSYDLLEMHSQGNELLYLCYLEQNAGYSKVENTFVKSYSLVNMLYAVMAGMTIDTFERAVYLNQYEGTNADVIMADGVITADEYSLLYTGICIDFGVEDSIDGYWEHGMTITSPCYYVSYSVSALSVLQLYEMANTDGFDVAKEAYLKLFTYVDEDPAMTMEEVLTYAGMLSYMDEQLYKNLYDYMVKK